MMGAQSLSTNDLFLFYTLSCERSKKRLNQGETSKFKPGMHVSPSFIVSMYVSINFCLFVFKQVNIQLSMRIWADSLVRAYVSIHTSANV